MRPEPEPPRHQRRHVGASPWEQARIAITRRDERFFPTLDAAMVASYLMTDRSRQFRLRMLASVIENLDGHLIAPRNPEAARRLCVSIKFVDDMARLNRETGSLSPKPKGNPWRDTLTGAKGRVADRIAARPDLTIDEPTVELAADCGLKVHRSSVVRLLLRLGLSHKKGPASA